jgi:imidazolonepropionase
MTTLIVNIKALLQTISNDISLKSGTEMASLQSVKNAFLIIEDESISDFGSMDDLPLLDVDQTIDARGKYVLPAWCDSHTHIVYAGNREQEFIDRIKGLSYSEIAARGGGILNSAKTLQQTSEDALYEQAAVRLIEVMKLGTGAIEIKSGYGLDLESELKMLRVIKRLDNNFPITIKATYLAAHALPTAYKGRKDAYIEEIINSGIPKVAQEGLADFIDVFCETGYFSVEDTDRIINAANTYGLIPKLHVNQFTSIGGVQVALKHKALSVDHLEIMCDTDITDLKGSDTMPVALPSCSYFLGIPYTPARKLIDNGLPLALATDYNPGSSPSGNMNFVIATACIKLKMTPEEAINAATINGAYAMGLEKTHGSIGIGKKANLIVTENIPSIGYLPYSFGNSRIDKVIINGKKI